MYEHDLIIWISLGDKIGYKVQFPVGRLDFGNRFLYISAKLLFLGLRLSMKVGGILRILQAPYLEGINFLWNGPCQLNSLQTIQQLGSHYCIKYEQLPFYVRIRSLPVR